MSQLGAEHFLSLPRPNIFTGPPSGVPDTTTLAAHDFDVDTRTGFMPPQVPLRRLAAHWDPWENALEDAITSRLELGERSSTNLAEREKSRAWRKRVKELPILSIDELKSSEVALRRAHLVLAWIMHFFVHSLPLDEPVRIPAPITLPLLQVSSQLQLPPVLTYSDDVLYNWYLNSNDPDELPTESTIRCQTTFTSTDDEAHFYLTSARMELAGVEALELMRSTMDEAFVGDDIAVRRITEYLQELVDVIHRLRVMLLDVKNGCDPQAFYHDIRPWFRGEDSQKNRKWVFEGLEQDPALLEPTELSGPSAGQSSLIHALDIFLGVDQYSHEQHLTGHDTDKLSSAAAQKAAFLERMQLYMPRHHRAFLNHISNNPRPLRNLVLEASSSSPSGSTTTKGGAAFLEAYNAAVMALKEFRDSHMIIVALYIITPARRHALETKTQDETAAPSIPDVESDYVGSTESPSDESQEDEPLKGTGGTDLVRFLKGVRDQTKGALIPAQMDD